MKSYSTALSGYLLLHAFLTNTEAFSPNHRRAQITQQPTTRSSLHLFGFNKDDKKEEKSEETKEKGGLMPFFGRRVIREEAKQNDGDTKSEQPLPATPAATAVKEEPVSVPAPAPGPAKKEPVNAQEAAKSLRAQAERMKLEAERMDAQLTLEKIEKLERQLAKARTKGGAVDDLQRQMDNLQAKLRGEAPKPVLQPKREVTKKEEPLKLKSSGTSMDQFSKAGAMVGAIVKDTGGQTQMVLGDDFEEILDSLKDAPSFLKKIMAATVEVDYDTIDDLNITEIAVRSAMLRSGDYSYSTMPKPSFTQKQIEEEAKKLENTWDGLPVTEPMTELAAGNYTKLAIYGLEYEYYTTSKLQDPKTAIAELEKIAEGEEWLGELVKGFNKSVIDSTVEQFFPKCTREEDGVPTNAQVQMLASSVLPKTKFSATGKPEPVLGGFVIRGKHNYENGDELIAAIDKELEKSPLGDKMTVLYTDDFTLLARAEEEDFDFDIFDVDENPPILYVLGPNICRESKPIQLSIVSAFGLATSWYLSIYPFLLNPGLNKRIEEQLNLAEAGMPFDLNWLTDLSVPLFYTFIGIQLSHEIAHRTIAGINNMKTSPPTFVPSLLTGVTSTVTTFRTPPKNKEVLFDYSVVGPLVGLLVSVAAVAVGSQLTLLSDPATLPCLPLDILRQSTLGGGIIDSILGAGALNVPAGSLGTPAVAGMTIPLHPVAIAGYISLFVNALGLLPIGTTDGGRMALTLFGRGPKLVVGNLFLFATLLIGLTGSDLFLFYFSFVIAFQTGNELPARNEVDDVSFSRVLVATAAWSLAFLTLVPFQ